MSTFTPSRENDCSYPRSGVPKNVPLTNPSARMASAISSCLFVVHTPKSTSWSWGRKSPSLIVPRSVPQSIQYVAPISLRTVFTSSRFLSATARFTPTTYGESRY